MAIARDSDKAAPTVLRPPVGLQVFLSVFMIIWCGAALRALIGSVTDGSGSVPITAGMLAFGLAFAYCTLRVSVVLDSDQITVRNVFTTRRIARERVQGFRAGPRTGHAFTTVIYVLLQDDTMLPLDVTQRPHIRRRGQPAVVQDQLTLLRKWLHRKLPAERARQRAAPKYSSRGD